MNEGDVSSSFRTVRILGDRIYLAVAIPTDMPPYALSINDQGWTDRGQARVGDKVRVEWPDMIGQGACWYDVLEVGKDSVVLRENTWFYDILPETHRVLRVRPYGDAR